MSAVGLIDELQPRTRVLATIAAVSGATLIRNAIVLAAALVGALVLARLSKVRWRALRDRLRHVEGFMLVLLVMLPFVVPGEPLVQVGPIAATTAGVAMAVSIAFKIAICSVTVFAILGSLDPVQIGQAAHALGVPAKLVRLFLFTVRYVSVLRAEVIRLVEAMRVRAFVPGSNAHCWRTYGNLAGTMLLRSLDRAHRVDEAMRCRGFTGQIPAAPQVAAPKHDFVFVGAVACAMIGLIVMDHVL